jgi:hypothetical protein
MVLVASLLLLLSPSPNAAAKAWLLDRLLPLLLLLPPLLPPLPLLLLRGERGDEDDDDDDDDRASATDLGRPTAAPGRGGANRRLLTESTSAAASFAALTTAVENVPSPRQSETRWSKPSAPAAAEEDAGRSTGGMPCRPARHSVSAVRERFTDTASRADTTDAEPNCACVRVCVRACACVRACVRVCVRVWRGGESRGRG